MAMTTLSSVSFASSWQPSDSTLSILRLLKGKILVTVQELGGLRGGEGFICISKNKNTDEPPY